MLQAMELTRGRYEIHFAARLSRAQHAKVRKVARVLGVNESEAMRAMIDAITVDDTHAAEYAPTLEDMDRELE